MIAPCHVVIAIDGPSGAGKSSVARRLAQILGYRYVDSGAMYRAVGWVVQTQGLSFSDTATIVELLQRTTIDLTFGDGYTDVWLDGHNITAQLRGEAVGAAASAVAAMPAVRLVITAKLRSLRRAANLVMEGRDIGTVVFPDATVKFFLTAALPVRGQRRFQEMRRAGQTVTLEEVMAAMAQRDAQDRDRTLAPLVQAAEARVIDTTDLTIDEVVQTMLSEIRTQFLQHTGKRGEELS